VIREDLGEGVFASIDPEPLAAASIAQIRPALLASGREVVVKVRRLHALEDHQDARRAAESSILQ
jgi:predicted unusual protein kinase regulating ubiquinone biosynthesis (AarF/ABC1/UbiB family)